MAPDFAGFFQETFGQYSEKKGPLNAKNSHPPFTPPAPGPINDEDWRDPQ
jgi:hypothetical protein